MSGTVWMFSDQIDDEDIDFMHREFVTYNMASIYNLQNRTKGTDSQKHL